MPWYVLFTKPQNEKKAASRLQAMNITAYCPLRMEVRQWSDRKKKVEVPLLPSMILVQLEEKERNIVFQAPGVVRYMHWLGKPAVVTEEEVTALKEVQAAKNNPTIQVETIQPGTKLDLSSMGFKAQEGTVKYVSGNQCWVVLEGLGFVIKMEM
ncbi:Transcription antitermination protein RfaH [Arenibacter antarcticus]|uniref:UpxY family transcription antiterminator n=1 Tax=Arenibacter antarcticus TaxID=2040469 RepID=A0ABW5VJK6_9FLAO|nr:UpxY family transcription antiterminator [Arenibacter sp. H213]MCM4167392.1 transcriptional elongation/antitermination factor NusG-like protein [Arenibacter sp. H213]